MTTPEYGQPAPAPKSKAKGCAGIGCLAVVAVAVVIGVIAAIGGTKTTVTSSGPDAPAASTTGAGAPAPAPAKPKTLLTLKGTGIKNSAQFTAAGNWTLAYTFDCASFGSQGNFMVSDETGMPLVNELKTKGAGSSPQYNAGQHHLEINSECDWTVTVTG
ncbi:hypothetical protein ABIA33_003378 [Streptacidiphilus sp. MAP12-16]|uniref:hypothetical protein n=1 Tax=Streptacidiphilus sp. MAP12-16 TaxID=3156300 RepID=UPI00351924CE